MATEEKRRSEASKDYFVQKLGLGEQKAAQTMQQRALEAEMMRLQKLTEVKARQDAIIHKR